MKNINIENEELIKMLNLISTQNDHIIKKLDEVLSKDDKVDSVKEMKNMKEFVGISAEMNKYLKERKLTYKQHYVLKYHLSNDYVSDTYLSDKTGVSYSSISQWKHKNDLFREFYDKIKFFK